MDEISIYAVHAVEMILRQNCSWRAARMPFTAAFPPKRRELLVTACYPAPEVKLWNPMIVRLAVVCSESGHRKTLIPVCRSALKRLHGSNIVTTNLIPPRGDCS